MHTQRILPLVILFTFCFAARTFGQSLVEMALITPLLFSVDEEVELSVVRTASPHGADEGGAAELVQARLFSSRGELLCTRTIRVPRRGVGRLVLLAEPIGDPGSTSRAAESGRRRVMVMAADEFDDEAETLAPPAAFDVDSSWGRIALRLELVGPPGRSLRRGFLATLTTFGPSGETRAVNAPPGLQTAPSQTRVILSAP